MTRLDQPSNESGSLASSHGALLVDQFMPNFVPGGMGGTETYARHIFSALSARTDLSIVAVVPENGAEFAHETRERVIPGVRLTDSTLGRLRGVLSVKLKGRRVSSLLRDGAVTFLPFTTPILSMRRLGPTVMTLHDIQHRELPELFSTAEKLYRRVTYERAARKVDHIITDSEYAKQSIIRELGIDADRISVIHLGVDTEGFAPNLDSRDDFVYYPARGWAHKNHARLISAMKLVREVHPDLRLVLTGGSLSGLGDLPEWVERRGLVTFDEVKQLYRRARVLAFPSLYEGFGFPPLEAMASGCPAAVSTAGSIPEICGDAAVYFDPRDPKAIAAGILTAIAERDRLVPLGLDRVKQFSWDVCATKHVDVFERVAHS